MPDGSPYGGAGLKVDRVRYAGTAASRQGFAVRSGIYGLGRVSPNYGALCRERLACGEGYRVSN